MLPTLFRMCPCIICFETHPICKPPPEDIVTYESFGVFLPEKQDDWFYLLKHPQLMSGEDADERKANALKQSLEYIDLFLDKTRCVVIYTIQ